MSITQLKCGGTGSQSVKEKEGNGLEPLLLPVGSVLAEYHPTQDNPLPVPEDTQGTAQKAAMPIDLW